jgi:hypothetical protein
VVPGTRGGGGGCGADGVVLRRWCS